MISSNQAVLWSDGNRTYFENFNDSLTLTSKVIRVPPYFYQKPYHLYVVAHPDDP